MDEPADMPTNVMEAYLDVLLAEMMRMDNELVDFMHTLPDEDAERLGVLVIESCERRRDQAEAACDMFDDA